MLKNVLARAVLSFLFWASPGKAQSPLGQGLWRAPSRADGLVAPPPPPTVSEFHSSSAGTSRDKNNPEKLYVIIMLQAIPNLSPIFSELSSQS